MPRLGTKYLPIVALLALGQTACDLDVSGIGEGFGEGLEHVDDFEFGPWPGGRPLHAIRILVSPADSLTSSWVVPQDVNNDGFSATGRQADELPILPGPECREHCVNRCLLVRTELHCRLSPKGRVLAVSAQRRRNDLMLFFQKREQVWKRPGVPRSPLR